jgi:hypothetical protein
MEADISNLRKTGHFYFALTAAIFLILLGVRPGEDPRLAGSSGGRGRPPPVCFRGPCHPRAGACMSPLSVARNRDEIEKLAKVPCVIRITGKV